MDQQIIIVLTVFLGLLVTRLPINWALGVVIATTFQPLLISGFDMTTILLIILALRLILARSNIQWLISNRFMQSYALYIVWSVISLIWAEDQTLGFDSVKAIVRILLVLALTIAIIREERDLLGIVWGMVFGILYVSGSLILNQFGVQTLAVKVGGSTRLTVESAAVNALAIQITWGLTLVIYYLRKIIQRRKSIFYTVIIGILLALSFVTIILTGSRTAMVCLVVGPALVQFSSSPRMTIAFLGLLIIGAIGLSIVSPPESNINDTIVVNLPFATRDTNYRVQAFLQGQDDTGREKIWQTGILIGLDNPVIGVGIGNAKLFYPRFSYKIWQDPYGTVQRTLHNSFVTVFAELGGIGVLLFLNMLNAWRNSGQRLNPRYKDLITIFTVLFFITAMTTNLEQTTFLMFVLGCVYQILRFPPVQQPIPSSLTKNHQGPAYSI